MRFFGVLLVGLGISSLLNGDDLARRAWELENSGDAAAARDLLLKASQGTSDLTAWRAYAHFLDRHRDPATRTAYQKCLDLAPAGSADRNVIARRLAALDLLAGDSDAAAKHALEFGSKAPALTAEAAKADTGIIEIPGPMRSFARMAALAPDVNPDDLLISLGKNVVTNGYQAMSSSEGLEQTEYLKLVIRYLSQARELDKLSGADKVIKIETCDSAQTGELLKVLGYRMRGGCGSDVVLETVNATRAFLTIDSGFPLAELEQSLRTNRPFSYDYRPSKVPVLYGPEPWLATVKEKAGNEFIDAFLGDPSLCRLYSAFGKMDAEVATALRESSGLPRLKAFAHVLDFYGGLFEIRNGKVVTPGPEKAWTDIVGAPTDKPAQFFEKLIAKDDGWLASLFDALLRANGPTRDYLTDPARLNRFYSALRGKVTSPGPARPVFRANTDMMLLATRLRIGPDGKAYVPGNLETWKNLFIKHPHGKYDGKLTRSAQGWKDGDDLLEALFALCRKVVDNEPLKIYLAISDIDRLRATRLQPATVERLVASYRQYGHQYSIFAESSSLDDKTIVQFLDTAEALNSIKDGAMRSDAVGSFQALASIWQILARQGTIDGDKSGALLKDIAATFESVHNQRDVFDASRSGVQKLVAASGAPKDLSSQDALMDLMAGAMTTNDSETQTQIVQDMIRVFEAQRLISLSTLFEAADNLEAAGKGQKVNMELINKLAGRISEIQAPRGAMTTAEKNALGYGYWTDRHIETERKLNLRSAVEKAAGDPEKLRDVRGLLAPVLRDTLVGFNYIHYAPPGAQILFTNPVFVRSHDFIGFANNNQTWKHTEVYGSGWPSNAGGRLVGSLSGLPYALAEAEQNFLIPTKEQALIWGDLVPQIIISSKIPRFWAVTPAQTHWINLHMNYGESIVADSAFDPAVRARLAEALSRHAPPLRVHKVDALVAAGQARTAIEQITPSELFAVASDFARNANNDTPIASEIRSMAKDDPKQLNYASIARAFGTPKPTLSNSYGPELLNLRTFPTLMGYSSRLMAETWESNLLYYAALSDDIHARPSELNLLIPAWTQQTVEKIFATHLEDWPALLRSLRSVGDDVRQKARKQAQQTAVAGGE